MSAHYIASAAAVASFPWAHQGEDRPAACLWHQAQPSADNPNVVLVLVEWSSSAARLDFERRAGVVRLYPEMMAQTVPTVIANAFGSIGVLPTDTGRQTLTKIRAWWPHEHLGETL